MNISDPFLRRPVATTLVMLGLLLFGGLSYRLLPVSDLPSVDVPTINVSAGLPGASPETMATAVATPLERQFSTIDGLDSMTSISTLGNVTITLQFSLKRDINDVPPDMDAAIGRATRLLPPGMPSPPSYRKVNPADQPILFLVITSPTLPMWQLNEYADTLMAQHISMINGVAQVNVFGQQRYAVHIQVDPFALAKVNEIARQTLPASGTTSLQGTAQPFESSMKGMDWLLVLTIVFIYIVLGILYESFVHPIMMTTMAALMAALPLALAAGSDSRRQLSLTAVGGLLISQLVTLYLTPLLFTYLDGLQQFVRQKLESFRGAKSLPAKPVEA